MSDNNDTNNLFVFTKEGIQKLKEELEQRKGPVADEIKQRLNEARAKGDLSENAEYEVARDDMNNNRNRIQELEYIINNAKIVDTPSGEVVGVSSVVTVLNLSTDDETTYTLVSPFEADVFSGKLSVTSKLGQALMGKTIGDVVSFENKNGKVVEYKIVSIK